MDPTQNPLRLDAAETAFFQRELVAVRNEVIRAEYAPLVGRMLVPAYTDIPLGSKFYEYRYSNVAGEAKIVDLLSNEVPLLNLSTEDEKTPILPLRTAFAYTIDDIRNAIRLGRPLDREYAMEARETIERKLDRLLLLGSAEHGVLGLFNQVTGGVGVIKLADAATGWSAASTTSVILAEMNALANAPWEQTDEVERPDTMVVPTTVYSYISTTPMSTDSSATILNHFLANQQNISDVFSSARLETAGTGSTGRAVVLNRDVRKLSFGEANVYEQTMPQQDGFRFEVQALGQFSGVAVHRPKSIAYRDAV